MVSCSSVGVVGGIFKGVAGVECAVVLIILFGVSNGVVADAVFKALDLLKLDDLIFIGRSEGNDLTSMS